MPKTGVEEIRRKQVKTAALGCILEDGIENLTLEKTAEKAGVSKGVIIYYFKSKKNLLVRSFEYFLDGYFSAVQRALSGTQSPYEPKDILLVIGRVVLGIEELSFEELRLTPVQAGAIITQLYMKSITDNDFQAVFRKIYDEYYTTMTEIFDYGKNSGKFAGTDTKTVVLQLMAMIEGLILFRAVNYIGDSNTAFECYREYVDKL